MPKRALALIVTCWFSVCASAETVYVTDLLQLGLHAAPDTSGEPLENLVSGAPLEVLERQPPYVRVRTAQGREGWVKAAFVVEGEPARTRVAELEEARARVTEIEETLARVRGENAQYEQRLEEYRRSVPLAWTGAALVVTLVAGFLAGLWWLDALIRRRHGGFRIY